MRKSTQASPRNFSRRFWSSGESSSALLVVNGNVGGGELMNAQNQVAQKGLANQQKQGKISGDQAKAIADIMQALTDQANINDNMQATVDQLVANAKGIKQVTKRQAENARNQQNSLE